MMNTKYLHLFFIIFLLGCGKHQEGNTNKETQIEMPVRLSLEQANILAELPLACVKTEYPYHLVHVLKNKNDVLEPHYLYPAFHGCYDWHSAVHGHWSLVKLLKKFPELKKAEIIKQTLRGNISGENILEELGYFQKEQNKHFERTYGWAWLLKLAEELHTWNDPFARELEKNLQPLTEQIAKMFINFLPKLKYPVRVGEHSNTAFGLTFAWDYATCVKNDSLQQLILLKAKEFYLNDEDCPLDWEPSGYDFLSPCLEEVDLMRRVLCKDTFNIWMQKFVPKLNAGKFEPNVGEVSDRRDGKLVHLDGLNFSRAWVLYGLARQYPEYSYLINIANKHVNHSLPNLVGDSYEGGHWLGTFVIYALDNSD